MATDPSISSSTMSIDDKPSLRQLVQGHSIFLTEDHAVDEDTYGKSEENLDNRTLDRQRGEKATTTAVIAIART
jgi:hypothetical protein